MGGFFVALVPVKAITSRSPKKSVAFGIPPVSCLFRISREEDTMSRLCEEEGMLLQHNHVKFTVFLILVCAFLHFSIASAQAPAAAGKAITVERIYTPPSVSG